VSIHFNGHPDRTLRGTETYYNPENHGEPSLALARALQEETVAALHLAGFETLDRGVRPDLLAGKPYGHFFSLRGPFPSALIEVLFLTNAQDAAILREERGREAAAEGIGRGILRFLEDDQAPLQAQADPCPWT
jgi:N-acetylmuramoyl-L-alanine amidase